MNIREEFRTFLNESNFKIKGTSSDVKKIDSVVNQLLKSNKNLNIKIKQDENMVSLVLIEPNIGRGVKVTQTHTDDIKNLQSEFKKLGEDLKLKLKNIDLDDFSISNTEIFFIISNFYE